MKTLLAINLTDFRSLQTERGTPVFKNARAIQNFLSTELPEIRITLAYPKISNRAIRGIEKAEWLVKSPEQWQSMDRLSLENRTSAQDTLKLELDKLINFIKKFEKPSQVVDQHLIDTLNDAFIVPDLRYVYTNRSNSRFVFTLWGFETNDAKYRGGHTLQLLSNRKGKVSKSRSKQRIDSNISKPTSRDKTDESSSMSFSGVERDSIKRPKTQDLGVFNELSDKDVVDSVSNISKPEAVDGSNSKNKNRSPGSWIVAVLLGLVVLLIVFYWFRNPIAPFQDEVGSNELPWMPLPPIDTTYVGEDPDDPAARIIIRNRLNVALDKGIDLNQFIAQQQKNLPDLTVLFSDSATRLIQYQIPLMDSVAWVDSLKALPEVRLVFNDALVVPTSRPSDPGFQQQKQSWYFNTIKAYDAWDHSIGKNQVIVAIIDNGFDLNHPEFVGKVVKPRNIPAGHNLLFPPGGAGSEHGTHVAATAIGNMNNNSGISGIAPNCSFMPIQVGDQNGVMSTLSIVMGVLYAIHQGADVINMSLGMSFPQKLSDMPIVDQLDIVQRLYQDEERFWVELYDFALENNIVVVQAAGNDEMVSAVDPMRRSNKTIIVSALDLNGDRASFSNFGQNSTLSAPGVDIYSAIPNGRFDYLQGTSMSSPIVAGAAALMLSYDSTLTPFRIRNILINTGIPVSGRARSVGPLIQLDRVFQFLGDSAFLSFPENPVDLKFTKGDWLCDNQLHNSETLERLTLFFHFDEQSGENQLELVEEDGMRCTCDVAVSLVGEGLEIQQLQLLDCEDGSTYQEYRFTCAPGPDYKGICTGFNLSDSSSVTFQLVKYR